MTRIGYVRVSTRDQHPEAQAVRLVAAGCDPQHIYTDHGVSGKLASRPEWDNCLRALRAGDTLVTVKLDRIGRSLKNLMEVVGSLQERGVDLVVLDQHIDTTTPSGKLIFHVLAAISEFERDLIRERTMDGLAAARARGRTGGSQPKLSPAQKMRAHEMYEEKGGDGKRRYTVEEIGNTFKVSRQTIYRALERTAR
jgi:DNA invertase Pin-like site-specific DNA recombinase